MQRSLFYEAKLMDWLHLNCCNPRCTLVPGIDWGIIFSVRIWTLWLHRKNVVFRDKNPRQNLRAETLAMASEIAYLGLNEKKETTRQTIQVKWLWPPINWFKVNSNGSSLGNLGIVGGGGLIRNENEEWFRGYAKAIGATTSVAAELWVLRDGICLCVALNLQAVIFELDAKLVVDLLRIDERLESGNDTILLACRKGMGDIPVEEFNTVTGKPTSVQMPWPEEEHGFLRTLLSFWIPLWMYPCYLV